MSVYRIFSAVILITLFAFSFGKSNIFAHQPATSPTHSLGGGLVVVIEDVTYCVRFSPNPSTDDYIHCTVIETGEQIAELRITDLNGQTLLSQSCYAAACSIDVSTLDAGNYWVIVNTSSCSSRNRVEIVR